MGTGAAADGSTVSAHSERGESTGGRPGAGPRGRQGPPPPAIRNGRLGSVLVYYTSSLAIEMKVSFTDSANIDLITLPIDNLTLVIHHIVEFGRIFLIS
jgi:hypothetical protein